jgi:hypothetical protein
VISWFSKPLLKKKCNLYRYAAGDTARLAANVLVLRSAFPTANVATMAERAPVGLVALFTTTLFCSQNNTG